ncbi:hypothetical protein AYI70_g5871 [Smittium culicis]|uniref:Uncharacterized protein n=1 Tax=Smittium culicis TaxID=133412 RepID=A0A1R1XSK8_9FUNG|nr:hypothetical protein AYI70_g5871 [Smittium culicis]
MARQVTASYGALPRRTFMRGAFRRNTDKKSALLNYRLRWGKGELRAFIVDYMAWSLLGSAAYYSHQQASMIDDMAIAYELEIAELLKVKANLASTSSTSSQSNHPENIVQDQDLNKSFDNVVF